MSEEQGQFVGSIPKSIVRIWLARLGMVIFCGLCVFVVWWSLFVRLQPINVEQRNKALEMSRLSDDLDQMRVRLSGEPAQQIETRYRETKHLLFADADQIQHWQDETTNQAAELGLDVKIDLSAPQAYPGMEQKLEFVQANIEMTPVATGFTNSAYQRILKFVQIFAGSAKRCDVKMLTVDGNFKSIQGAKAVVQLLAEPKGQN